MGFERAGSLVAVRFGGMGDCDRISRGIFDWNFDFLIREIGDGASIAFCSKREKNFDKKILKLCRKLGEGS